MARNDSAQRTGWARTGCAANGKDGSDLPMNIHQSPFSSKSLFKQMRVATGLANIGWFTWQRMIAMALQLAGFHNG